MQGERGWGLGEGGGDGGGGGGGVAGDAAVFRRTYEAEASRPGSVSASGVLCLAGAHRWCPQRYMGRAKRALIKGFDQKKTHHLPSSPPFCTQWISRAKTMRARFPTRIGDLLRTTVEEKEKKGRRGEKKRKRGRGGGGTRCGL